MENKFYYLFNAILFSLIYLKIDLLSDLKIFNIPYEFSPRVEKLCD
jgi:hypothetical protein